MTDALFISFFFQSLSLVSHASSRCFSFSDFQNSLGFHIAKVCLFLTSTNLCAVMLSPTEWLFGYTSLLCCDYVISIVPQTTFVRYFCCASVANYWYYLEISFYGISRRIPSHVLTYSKSWDFLPVIFRLMLLPRRLSHSAPPCSSLHEISHVALLRVRCQVHLWLWVFSIVTLQVSCNLHQSIFYQILYYLQLLSQFLPFCWPMHPVNYHW